MKGFKQIMQNVLYFIAFFIYSYLWLSTALQVYEDARFTESKFKSVLWGLFLGLFMWIYFVPKSIFSKLSGAKS